MRADTEHLTWPCRLVGAGASARLRHDLSALPRAIAAPVVAFLQHHRQADEYTDPWTRDLRPAFASAAARRAAQGARTVPVSLRLAREHHALLKRFGAGSGSVGLARLVALIPYGTPVDPGEVGQVRGKLFPRVYYISADAKKALVAFAGSGRFTISTAVRTLIERARKVDQ